MSIIFPSSKIGLARHQPKQPGFATAPGATAEFLAPMRLERVDRETACPAANRCTTSGKVSFSSGRMTWFALEPTRPPRSALMGFSKVLSSWGEKARAPSEEGMLVLAIDRLSV